MLVSWSLEPHRTPHRERDRYRVGSGESTGSASRHMRPARTRITSHVHGLLVYAGPPASPRAMRSSQCSSRARSGVLRAGLWGRTARRAMAAPAGPGVAGTGAAVV